MLFEVTETHGRDKTGGGYIEACDRDWQYTDDFRISARELNSPKSMNTNLHVLEAYSNLLRACREAAADGADSKTAGLYADACAGEDKTYSDAAERVHAALDALTRITVAKIINSDFHFDLFFDLSWNRLTDERMPKAGFWKCPYHNSRMCFQLIERGIR